MVSSLCKRPGQPGCLPSQSRCVVTSFEKRKMKKKAKPGRERRRSKMKMPLRVLLVRGLTPPLEEFHQFTTWECRLVS